MTKRVGALLIVASFCASCSNNEFHESQGVIEVNVVGAIKEPGKYTLKKGDGLINALVIADGIIVGAGSKVRIKRKSKDHSLMLSADVYEILSGKTPDIMLQDNDMVMVPNVSEWAPYVTNDVVLQMKEYIK